MAEGENTAALIRRMLGGEKVPQTPCVLFINYPFISSVTKIKAEEYFFHPESMMEAQVETYRRLGLTGPIWPDFGTVCEASALGGEVVFDAGGIPSIKSDPHTPLEHLADISPADPLKDGWMPRYLAFLEYFQKNKPADFQLTGGNIMAPFTTAAMLRGIDDFCADILEEPELIEKLLQTCTKTIIAFFREQKKILRESFDRIFMSDDVSSMVSIQMFEEFVRPTYEAIFHEFPDIPHWLHNDGRATHLSEKIAAAGVQVWHIGKTEDMGEILRRTDGKVLICGNLDPLAELLHGTPEEVLARTKKEIKDYRFSSKLILSTGGFLSWGTPIENVKAMLRASSEL